MNGKKQAMLFRKKFKLKAINSATLSEALKEMGYTLVEFNGISEQSLVAELIDALQLKDQTAHCKCFAYQDENYRLIFLHEDLNDEERTIVLAHEIGHIWNRHMDRNSIIGEDVIQEFDANEFAHYLLLDKAGTGKKRMLVALSCVLIAVLCVLIAFASKYRHDQATYTEKYYRVGDGKKYHLKDCIYIKDRKDVYRLTLEEYESGEYEPCSVCNPNQD